MEAKVFLDRYLPDWQKMDDGTFRENAGKNAINAALQRNKTYITSGLGSRLVIRNFWLDSIQAVDFGELNSLDDWRTVVIELKASMNGRFPSAWHNVFRIAHSQKSLSVYWKYLYCKSKVLNTQANRPLIMPLDRRVQSLAGLRSNEILPWGRIDDFNEYYGQLTLIAHRLGFPVEELIDWEIENFN